MMMTQPSYSLTQSSAQMALDRIVGRMYGQYNVRGPVFYPPANDSMGDGMGMGVIDPQSLAAACGTPIAISGTQVITAAGQVLDMDDPSLAGQLGPCATGAQLVWQASRSGSAYYAGDTFDPVILGATPLVDVGVQGTLNGTPAIPSGLYAAGGGSTLGGQSLSGPIVVGNTDSYGNWNADYWDSGYAFAAADVGTWSLTWYAGGQPVGSAQFTVALPANYTAPVTPTGSVAPNQQLVGDTLVPVSSSTAPSTTSPNQSVPPTTPLTTMPTNIQSTGTLLASGTTATGTTSTASTTPTTSATSSSDTILGLDPTTLALIGGGALLLLFAMGRK